MPIQSLAVQHFVYGATRSLFAGASLCYAIKNEKYLQVPLTILFPSVYAGYHLYKNKDNIVEWLRDI
jgi:hypothetical protein